MKLKKVLSLVALTVFLALFGCMPPEKELSFAPTTTLTGETPALIKRKTRKLLEEGWIITKYSYEKDGDDEELAITLSKPLDVHSLLNVEE